MNAHLEHLARMGDTAAQAALARQQWRRADAETLDAVQAWVVERAIALGQWLAIYPPAAADGVTAWVESIPSGRHRHFEGPWSWDRHVHCERAWATGYAHKWACGVWVHDSEEHWQCVWVRLLYHLRLALLGTWPQDEQ